ncbi:P-loop containing nucleoside triphosphate hydrolase [Glarea lozoyensis ATCC 20868]|uniref:p-loop containing nucleoside triphosphate hydrolase n=1 Tax=Glarea lozoyensis (strain ATCC 20868 / MF5171) TaxID=1116229 RepID=S3CGE6_GLAL2|nr:P-loop containing nucleoside triphosphate hydrolase [Glarea lozoyensis ATCC 20868]EPE25597.1 P-loop containing nucleoside triphosphate hydrolase [Glarea lozoyensis ATCC 20868]
MWPFASRPAKEAIEKRTNLVSYSTDIEDGVVTETHLMNNDVKNFTWKGVTVTVKDSKTGAPKVILDNIDGVVQAGEILALMGPSGCGKTSLLNVLARRDVSVAAKVEGTVLINGNVASTSSFREMTSYVEQEDALIGSLTVMETMYFAARLSHKNTLTKAARIRRISTLIASFGLTNQANNIIGTPIRKGISGGQKRRLSVISQLITAPKILFLDEPTSGLDSTASSEVISFVKNAAKKNNLIVICSIHQPSTTTFQLFDKLLLLSGGRSHYFGSVAGIQDHFNSLNQPLPLHMNPAEFLLDLMNTDFARGHEDAEARLSNIHRGWLNSELAKDLDTQITSAQSNNLPLPDSTSSTRSFFIDVATLVHRSFIKSYRDVVAYGIRIAMYFGLAVMMGTVWLRMDYDQRSIQPVINAIFFGGAFMSFMAVAYVPAFLEDRANFVKERHNGLYGATAFMVSNFIIGLPYQFLISILFSIIAYWLSNFRPTADGFFLWVMWLFLDLVAAESLVVLVSSIFPIFVVALALTAFANGLWMCVDGFMVTPAILNVFYKYVFSYIDYQSYVFKGMMVNQFAESTYTCGSKCECMYVTPLAAECKIAGQGVLDQYDYNTGNTGKWVGILLGIVLGYRMLGTLVLMVKKH